MATSGSIPVRPPGIVVRRAPAGPEPLGLMEAGVPVFLGLCERGPTNEPVRIGSMAQFRDVFGHLAVGTYLAESVDGFFLNGGDHCFVMRIAHLFEQGKRQIATKASTRLRDAQKQNSLLVQAISEGSWGDALRVSVSPTPASVQTFITMDAHATDTSVSVKSTYGFARGTLVKIFDDEHAEYRVLSAIEGRTLTWSTLEPLAHEFRSSAPTMVEPIGFDLVVQSHQARETFRGLNLARQSPWYAERVINGTSKLITVSNLESQSGTPGHFPVEAQNVALENGADGLYTVTAEDFIGADFGPGQRYGLKGIAEFEEIDLIVMPDLPWCVEQKNGFQSVKDMEFVQQEAVDICEARKDRFCILDFPPDTTPTGAMQWRRLFDTSYAAFYYPYLQPSTPRPLGSRFVPPSGHVAGVYARCDQAEGVFRAPANETLEGVVDLSVGIQQNDLTALNREGINCMQTFAQRGIRVWGARTASSDPMLRFVNVRRTIAAIARALQIGLQWTVFENNGPELWSMLERDCEIFLEQLWRQGYLRGASPEEGFFVTCSEENNPIAGLNKGRVVVDVGVAPFRPSEFIAVRVVQEIDVLSREDGI